MFNSNPVVFIVISRSGPNAKQPCGPLAYNDGVPYETTIIIHCHSLHSSLIGHLVNSIKPCVVLSLWTSIAASHYT